MSRPVSARAPARGWRALHPGVRIAIVVVAFVIVVNIAFALLDSSTRGADETAPRSSSLSTGRTGLAAFAELLRRNDRGTRALRGNLASDALTPGRTLVVLDPVGLDREESGVIRRFVERGGRLLAGGAGATGVLDRLFDAPPTWSPTGTTRAEVVGTAPEAAGLRSVRTAGSGSWSDTGATTPVLAGDGRALATVADVGRGRVVALADASALQNRLLGAADNAGFGLGATGDAGEVLFAEGLHGYGQERGLGAIPGRWQAALIGLALAALLGVVAAGRRLGPPEEAGRTLPPPRKEYVDALAGSLARTRRPQEALAPLQAAARARVARQAGLPPDAGEADVRAAGARLGWSPADIDGLFAPPVTDAEVVAAGKSLARANEGGAQP